MPSCLLLESIIQDLVYEGDNHHEDPVVLFTLTSSRLTQYVHRSITPV